MNTHRRAAPGLVGPPRRGGRNHVTLSHHSQSILTYQTPNSESNHRAAVEIRAAHLPRHLPTRRDAASTWLIREEPLPKETHRPGASRRRGETPHLLESSLIAICDRASTANIIMKLRRFTKRLRYRCGMGFALLNRPHPTRQGGLFHGDAANPPRCPRGSVARGLAAASQFALRAHPTRRLRRGRIPRRTFTILARNQTIGSMRE